MEIAFYCSLPQKTVFSFHTSRRFLSFPNSVWSCGTLPGQWGGGGGGGALWWIIRTQPTYLHMQWHATHSRQCLLYWPFAGLRDCITFHLHSNSVQIRRLVQWASARWMLLLYNKQGTSLCRWGRNYISEPVPVKAASTVACRSMPARCAKPASGRGGRRGCEKSFARETHTHTHTS